MQSTVMEATKMEAARVALHSSYRQKLDLHARDSEHIRNFLHHYNNLCTKRRDHTISVMSATDSAPSNPISQSQSRPIGDASGLSIGAHQLPDQEELNWWGGLWSNVGDGDEGRGEGRLEAVQDSNQGESGLGGSVGSPTS